MRRISPQTTEQIAAPEFITADEEEHVDRWLALAVILLLAILFSLGVFVVKRVFTQTPLIRTALERELVGYQQRLQKNPSDLDARIGVAQVYMRMGKKTDAVSELKVVLDIKPGYWDAIFQLGLIYLDSGEKAKAIAQFKKAAKAKPEDELAYYQLGQIALESKRNMEAVQYLEKTVQISPILADAHYLLGKAYERIEDKASAKTHYQEALKYIPDYAEAKDGLARVGP